MLRKIGIIAVLSLIVAALAAVPALAGKPHEVPSGQPITCSHTSTTTITCGGELAGLGNVDFITVTVDVTGGCSTSQEPPKNNPPGHLQSTSPPIAVDENGRATFSQPVSLKCPKGLNPFFGDTATIFVRDADTGQLLFSKTVDVT